MSKTKALECLFRRKNVADILATMKENEEAENSLRRNLTVRDLTGFGIAAIVGAGIFSTIGSASSNGGPAVIFLFLFTAMACGFAAFAYAEFAAMVPVSGSAYTYSYVAFGELVAWIIGWALIMEYAVGNITVAISWSDYFTGFLESGGLHLPQWVQMDFLTAYKGYHEALALMEQGKEWSELETNLQASYQAWTEAPKWGVFHFVTDLPALLIIVLVTFLVYRGMKESRNASNLMVVIKLCVILLVIAVGIFYVDTENWNPFAPNGLSGILKGVSAVFFAYIGFDAISTTAEECQNPQRDLPRGMMWAIIVCTILYIAIALILTGMVPYYELNVGDPLAHVFEQVNLKWISGIIAVSAVVAMASVLLVFQMGQPRIWMSMSRDGLLPPIFSRIHPRFKTPSFATIVTGFAVGVPALFLNLTLVTDLCSIGTLFAFVLVCGGVLVMQNNPDIPQGKFKTPYINSRYIFPLLVIIGLVYAFTVEKTATMEFITNQARLRTPAEMVKMLNERQIRIVSSVLKMNHKADSGNSGNLENQLEILALEHPNYEAIIRSLPIRDSLKYESGFPLFLHKIPGWLFLITVLVMTVLAFKKRLSLIPLLGMLSCLYMMVELNVWNWIYFGIWLIMGLIIYFSYGFRNSKLANKKY